MREIEESVITPSNVVAIKAEDVAVAPKRLARFISENTEQIVRDWESFALTLIPASSGMTPLALRDHIHQILAFIVPDMERPQTPEEQSEKSHGSKDQPNTAAQVHAALRFAGGFDIGQMISEYRALRASVLKLWGRTNPNFDAQDIDDVTRFSEAIDQELTESVSFYTDKVAQTRELVIGMVGHDLRLPVQAILLSAELILHMGQLNERQTMLINKLMESTHRMEELISNLLDITRTRFGASIPTVRAMMNMGFVAQQVVEEVRVVNPKRRIELVMSGGLMGEWDRARIGQVFSNLLDNAIKYGFQDSPIRVALRGDSNGVAITVGDNGSVIPVDQIGKIFDPLIRGVTDTNDGRSSGNLGLGLYITKEVILAHGGTLDVTSSELDGTIFTAVIPRSKSASRMQGTRS